MTLSLKTILLAVLATKTVSSPLKDLMERGQGGGYCAFYTEDACENRSGGTDYSVDNDGIIQNGGKYLSCGTGEFALISYPPGDSAGDNPNHCVTFPGQSSSDPCNDLTELGFTPGDGTTLFKSIPSSFREPNKSQLPKDVPALSLAAETMALVRLLIPHPRNILIR
jgi:hypothetical protein